MPWPVSDHAPVPSKADYSSKNVAPLFCFFLPLVNQVVTQKSGNPITKCQMVFQYENNTPNDTSDDIFVQHPDCIGEDYTPPPVSTSKSPELRHYEEIAKESWRLKQFEEKSPAHIKYFQDLPGMAPVQCP